MPVATTRSAACLGAVDDADDAALDLENDDAADCVGSPWLACGRAGFSYHLLPDLPEPCLRLTIRKLDGSYFDVEIERSAAVWELKATIESVFVALDDDVEKNAISWQHVWSHFCLCFKDEKLTDDKAILLALGIIDGDELHFAQHLSADHSPCRSSKRQNAASHTRSRTSLDDFGTRSWTLLDDLIEEDEGEKLLSATRHSTSILQEGYGVYQHHEKCMKEGRKKGSFFRRWFSFSR